MDLKMSGFNQKLFKLQEDENPFNGGIVINPYVFTNIMVRARKNRQIVML